MSQAHSSIASTVEPSGPQAPPTPTLTAIAAAWIVGSATGAGLVSGYLLIIGLLSGQASMGLMIAGLGLPIAFFGWIAGLLTIGLPVGAALHACGFRSPRAGAIAGAALVAMTTVLWAVPVTMWGSGVTERIFPTIILAAAAAGLAGAVVGWVVVRVAYGKDAPR